MESTSSLVFYIMEYSNASVGRLFLCVLVTSLVFFMYCRLVLSLVGKSLMLSLFISIIYDQYITLIRIPLLFLLLDFGLSTAAVCSHWLFFFHYDFFSQSNNIHFLQF